MHATLDACRCYICCLTCCIHRCPHTISTMLCQVFEVRANNLKKLQEVEKQTRFKCGTFGASSLSEKQLATGTFQGQLQVLQRHMQGPALAVAWHLSLALAPVVMQHKCLQHAESNGCSATHQALFGMQYLSQHWHPLVADVGFGAHVRTCVQGSSTYLAHQPD